MSPALITFIRLIFPDIMRFVEQLYAHTEGDPARARARLLEMADQWQGTEAGRAATDAVLEAYARDKK